MRMLRTGVLFLALTLLAGSAFARSDVPIVNYDHVAIPAKPGRTLDDVMHAIKSAGDVAGHWTASDVTPGHMKLTVNTRAHTASVDVTFDLQSYSIHYADSSNLNYRKNGSEELIHPHYNGWVSKLKSVIDRQLN